MKIIPVMLSILLVYSMLGYGMHASAQTHCTASQPCVPVCGDHVCAPGEIPGSATTGSNTKSVSQSTNQTVTPSIATQVNLSANATVAKTANKITNGTSTQENMAMGTNATATKPSNGTMTSTTSGTMTNGTMNTTPYLNSTTNHTPSIPVTPVVPSPNAQVAAGTQPASVKCSSGFYLVINTSDSRSACVTQSTVSVLEARGWGHAAS